MDAGIGARGRVRRATGAGVQGDHDQVLASIASVSVLVASARKVETGLAADRASRS